VNLRRAVLQFRGTSLAANRASSIMSLFAPVETQVTTIMDAEEAAEIEEVEVMLQVIHARTDESSSGSHRSLSSALMDVVTSLF